MTTNTGLDDENKQIDVSCNRKFDFHLIFRKFSLGNLEFRSKLYSFNYQNHVKGFSLETCSRAAILETSKVKTLIAEVPQKALCNPSPINIFTAPPTQHST